jgi:hypothetical protein
MMESDRPAPSDDAKLNQLPRNRRRHDVERSTSGDVAVTLHPLTPAMQEAVTHTRRGRRRTTLIIGVIAGVAALIALGLLVRQMIDPTSSGQPALLFLLTVLAFGVLGVIWAVRSLRMLAAIDESSNEFRSYARSTGSIHLFGYRSSNGQGTRYNLQTPAGESVPISNSLFAELVPSADAPAVHVNENPVTWLNPEPNFWELPNATILYHRPTWLIFEIRDPNGRLIYQDPKLAAQP